MEMWRRCCALGAVNGATLSYQCVLGVGSVSNGRMTTELWGVETSGTRWWWLWTAVCRVACCSWSGATSAAGVVLGWGWREVDWCCSSAGCMIARGMELASLGPLKVKGRRATAGWLKHLTMALPPAVTCTQHCFLLLHCHVLPVSQHSMC